MIKVFVATPTTGTIVDLQTYALRAIEKKYAGKVELVYPKQCVRRIFHDFARNGMVEEFMESGCDILWFLDSDISPPTDILNLVVEDGDKWDLAGAPYPVFMTPGGEKDPAIVYCVYDNAKGVGYAPTDIPRSGKTFVNAVATGCMFIKRGVLEKMEKPYFNFEYKNETREMTVGEDLGFCRKVNAMGYQFFVDYSLVCKHYKNVCLHDVNNYAVEYANKSVLKYDSSVKGKIRELAEMIVKLKKENAELRASKEARNKLVIAKNLSDVNQGSSALLRG